MLMDMRKKKSPAAYVAVALWIILVLAGSFFRIYAWLESVTDPAVSQMCRTGGNCICGRTALWYGL